MPSPSARASAGGAAQGTVAGSRVAGRYAVSAGRSPAKGVLSVGQGLTSSARGAEMGVGSSKKTSLDGIRAAGRVAGRVARTGGTIVRVANLAINDTEKEEDEESNGEIQRARDTTGMSSGSSYRRNGRRNVARSLDIRPSYAPNQRPSVYRPPRRGPYRQNLRGVAQRAARIGIDPAEAERQVIGAARSLAQKLHEHIAAGHDTSAFMIALILAAAKDFLDVFLVATGLGFIPGANFLVGLFLSSFLFFFMMGKGWMKRFRVKIKFWLLGLFVDGLPAVSALPMNSLLVLDAWRRVRKRAKKAEGHMKELPNLTQRQLESLYEEVAAG